MLVGVCANDQIKRRNTDNHNHNIYTAPVSTTYGSPGVFADDKIKRRKADNHKHNRNTIIVIMSYIPDHSREVPIQSCSYKKVHVPNQELLHGKKCLSPNAGQSGSEYLHDQRDSQASSHFTDAGYGLPQSEPLHTYQPARQPVYQRKARLA